MSQDETQFSPEYRDYSQKPLLLAINLFLGILSALAIIARIYCRKRRKIDLGVDDWLALVALGAIWGTITVFILDIKYGGVGMHSAVINVEHPKWAENSLYYTWVGNFPYIVAITAVKVSVLFMYYRIFQTNFIKISGYLMGVILSIWFFSMIFFTVFSCTPIARHWNFFISGKCIVSNWFYRTTAIATIITDIITLFLPFYEIYHMYTPTRQKVAIGFVLALGIVATIISGVRLMIVDKMFVNDDNRDFLILLGTMYLWTTAEITSALICSSLPALQPLVHLVFDRCIPVSVVEQESTPTLVTIGGTKHMRKDSVTMGNPKASGQFQQIVDYEGAEETIVMQKISRKAR